MAIAILGKFNRVSAGAFSQNRVKACAETVRLYNWILRVAVRYALRRFACLSRLRHAAR